MFADRLFSRKVLGRTLVFVMILTFALGLCVAVSSAEQSFFYDLKYDQHLDLYLRFTGKNVHIEDNHITMDIGDSFEIMGGAQREATGLICAEEEIAARNIDDLKNFTWYSSVTYLRSLPSENASNPYLEYNDDGGDWGMYTARKEGEYTFALYGCATKWDAGKRAKPLSEYYQVFRLTINGEGNSNGNRKPAATSGQGSKPTMTAPSQNMLYVSDRTVFKAKASSVYNIKYNHEYTVGADMAVDGVLETAWNEGASGTGVGEWIQLTPADGKRYTYYGFKIANGFQYHTYYKGDRWKKNNRVASLKVYADGYQLIGTYRIEDRYNGYETIYFHAPVTCNYLRFEINSVWEGKDFSDTCISELRPF